MWNIATPFGFGGAIRHTVAFIRPNRIVRDLSGLPAVLGRFGPFEARLAATSREIRKAQRLRFKVFYEEDPATPRQRAALTRQDICPFDKSAIIFSSLTRISAIVSAARSPKSLGSIVFFAGIPPHATKAFTAKRNSISLHCWPAIPASASWNSAALASMRNIDRSASSSSCGAAFGSMRNIIVSTC